MSSKVVSHANYHEHNLPRRAIGLTLLIFIDKNFDTKVLATLKGDSIMNDGSNPLSKNSTSYQCWI